VKLVWAIVRREVQSYFVSPVAYAFMAVFLLVTAIGLLGALEAYSRMPVSFLQENDWTLRTFIITGKRGFGFIPWAHVAILLSLPGLSMRLLSEEKKGGTAELLFTSPLTTTQIVLGKYFGAVAIYVAILTLTFPMLAVLAVKAQPEWGALGVAYLGLLMHGGFLLAMGLFASSLTENQFVALILTLVMVVPFYAMEFLTDLVGPTLEPVLSASAVTIGLHRAAYGRLDSHDLVLWIGLIAAFLFMSGRVLDSGRWR